MGTSSKKRFALPSVCWCLMIALAAVGYSAHAQQPQAAWTILIFMNADNNLEPDAIRNINAMEKVGSTDRVRIAVQVRRNPSYDYSNGDWSGTRRFLIAKDDDPLTITSAPQTWPCADHQCSAQVESSVDMDTGDSLLAAMKWAFSAYPADQYALILWGHGRGWKKEVVPPASVGRGLIGGERSSGRSLSNSEVADAMFKLRKETNTSIAFLGFDACNMQLVEVASEFNNLTTTLVASQEIEPTDGWPYETIFGDLVANPASTAADLAMSVVDKYAAAFPTQGATLSVLKMAAAVKFEQSINDFLKQVLRQNWSDEGKIRRSFERVQKFSYAEYVDLRHLFTLLASEFGLTKDEAFAAFEQSHQEFILYSKVNGPHLRNATGLSIYFPAAALLEERYYSLKFGRESVWSDVLRRYFSGNMPSHVSAVDQLIKNPTAYGVTSDDELAYKLAKVSEFLVARKGSMDRDVNAKVSATIQRRLDAKEVGPKSTEKIRAVLDVLRVE